MAGCERRILPAGDRALLVELLELDAALGLFDAVSAAELPGVVEVVPAARTVLVRFDPLVVTADDLAAAIGALEVGATSARTGDLVQIGVHYDGEDLAEVAELLGVSERELIERHTSCQYRVAFGGFAPGFAYLTGGDPLLRVPRRRTPRTRIPAGAVGLAGTFSGVYPRESPGGWQIIGRTDMRMWDLQRDPPAALRPGDRVTFAALPPIEPAENPPPPIEPVENSQPSPIEPVENSQPSPIEPVEIRPALVIVNSGPLTLVQDEGRPGLAAMGVATSGALDRRALHAANRLVGNPTDEAAIEFSFDGEVRAVGELIVAVAGERLEFTVGHADGRITAVDDSRPIALGDGESLAVTPTRGVRSYLAVRGGFDVPQVLGSRSTDTLSGIGPPPLTAGSRLAVRNSAGLGSVGAPQPWPDRLRSGVVELPVILGPRDDWFTPEAVTLLFGQPWRVTPRSNRVGLRLRGEQPLERRFAGELPSEGVVPGALQLPADGQPVLFLADHPVTGGYPVIGVLHSSALDLAGQLGPGTVVRFSRAANLV